MDVVGGDMQEAFEVDVTPDAAALRIFKNLTFTPWFALGEFVDNSITSALLNIDSLRDLYGPEYRLRVEINFDEDGGITIDDNAAGIRPEEFARALKTGDVPPVSDRGLSVHGAGMKAAAFWWGQTLTIDSWPLDGANGWRVQVDVEKVASEHSGFVKVTPIPQRRDPGTRIKIEGLWQKRPQTKTLSNIRAYLPSIYRLFLDSSEESETGLKMDLTFLGQQLEYQSPELLVEPFWPSRDGPEPGAEPRLWRRDVQLELDSGKRVEGWVGIRDVMNRDLSGFFLHYRGKGIAGVNPADADAASMRSDQSAYKPRQIFGQQGSYRDQTIIGEFDVSGFGKSLTTDSVKWSAEDQDDFIEKILLELKDPDLNIWAMSQNFMRQKRKQSRKQQHESSKVVSDEMERLKESSDQSGVDHADRPEAFDPVEEFDEFQEITIHDREGHEHVFQVYMVKDRNRPLIQVVERSQTVSQLVLNEVHPSLDDLGPLEGQLLQLFTRFGLALGGAEVFSNQLDRSATRRKFEDILQLLVPGQDLNRG